MSNPTVSFVVPCYRLGHWLGQCVNSILGQTYGDLEVLIMDDCSPDNTAEVARSFQDERVKYFRNETNLGALPNYNKGIGLSRGKYVWLISADDYLRRGYVLERYVKLMEAHSQVSYVFCPGVGVSEGTERGVLAYSVYRDRDQVVSGRVFLETLLRNNLVLAPAVMARRECYEKISFFPIHPIWSGVPIDLIWGGDWYLWCLFALEGDVGYFAEPMICYREHDLSSTTLITKNNLRNCFLAEIGVRWKVKGKAAAVGYEEVSKTCAKSLAAEYARHLTGKQYRSSVSTVTMAEFEESLCQNSSSQRERQWLRGRVLAGMGDRYYDRGEFSSAKKYYQAAAGYDRRMIGARVKKMLLSLGKPGNYLRRTVQRFR